MGRIIASGLVINEGSGWAGASGPVVNGGPCTDGPKAETANDARFRELERKIARLKQQELALDGLLVATGIKAIAKKAKATAANEKPEPKLWFGADLTGQRIEKPVVNVHGGRRVVPWKSRAAR